MIERLNTNVRRTALILFIIFTPVFYIYKSLLLPCRKILGDPEAVITEPFYRAVLESELSQAFSLVAFLALPDTTARSKHGNHAKHHNKQQEHRDHSFHHPRPPFVENIGRKSVCRHYTSETALRF